MERDVLIKKWLDNNLTSAEQKQFEQLEDYDQLIKLSDTSRLFKAPKYKPDEEEKKLNITPKEKSVVFWKHPLFKVAAILVLSFGIFYYTYTLDTTIKTEIAKHTSTKLPDESLIELNAASTLTFNKSNWKNKRQVKLNGEAYFKVAKGSKFKVITPEGTVTVLGTEFNVKQRKNYFEVTCYEGRVAVQHNNKIIELEKNLSFIFNNNKPVNQSHQKIKPDWLNFESNYKSVPLNLVLEDLQHQYNITINAKNVDTKQIFTGSITHKNLDLAIQSIVTPLNMTYVKKGNVITLKGE